MPPCPRLRLAHALIPPGPVPQRLLEVLEPVGKDYFCNVLCLQQMTDERPLTTVAFYVLHTSGTIQVCGRQ